MRFLSASRAAPRVSFREVSEMKKTALESSVTMVEFESKSYVETPFSYDFPK